MRPQQTDKRSNSGFAIAFSSAFILLTAGILACQIPTRPPNFWCNIFLGTTLFLVLELFFPFLVEIRQRDLGYFLLSGLLLSFFNILWTKSVELNGAAIAILLGSPSASLAALFGFWFLGKGISPAKILSLLLCLTGCTMLLSCLGTGQIGISIGILAGLAYALFSLTGLFTCSRGFNPWTILLYSLGSAVLFLLIFGVIFDFFGSP